MTTESAAAISCQSSVDKSDWEFPACDLELPPYAERRKTPKEKGRLLHIGLINKVNLLKRLAFAGRKSSNFLHPTTKSRVCIEAFTGFHQVPSPDGLMTTALSQGRVLGQLLAQERQTACRAEGVWSLQLSRSSPWVKLVVISSQ